MPPSSTERKRGVIEAVESASETATVRLGKRLATKLREGDIVLIDGPLGAGKTVLVRGVVAGIDPAASEHVSSQSYVIVGEYPTEPKTTHVDLYRLETTAAVVALGWEEVLYGGGIVLVEWPSLLEPLLESDDPVLRVRMSIESDGCRRIELCSEDARLAEVAKWVIRES